MKIHKLHIYNIASIEDATIDFTAAPLAGSDVFLITGKTGAGKSTILDAISLALYNTTPRLNEASGNRVGNNKDNLALDDPRQLMRRETGEASVELLFEGIDGKKYEALWHVQRGEKKLAESNLNKVDWSLKCLDSGEVTKGIGTKVGEVKSKIVEAVGLEFDQFCRTTMLAQGKFTEFLKSPEDKKSEILAKITQFTEYAEIGKKIFEIDSEKKKALDEAIKKAGDTGKTPEELKTLNDAIDGINADLKRAGDDKDSVIAKKTWLELQTKIEDKNENISKLQAEISTDEFKNKSSLVSDWDKSLEARQQLGIRQSKQSEVSRQERLLEGYRLEYAKFLGVLDELQKKVDDNKDRERKLSEYLDSEKSNKDVYADAGVLIEALKRIADTRTSIGASKEKIEGLDREINCDLKPKFEAAVDIVEKEQKIGDLLSEAKEMLEAILAVEKYDEAVRNHARQEKNLQTLHEEIKKLDEEIVVLKGEIGEQEAEVEKNKAVYEKQKDTVEDWAKSMRSKISSGEVDVCPVCGQKVADVAFDEQELSSLYESAKTAYEQADEALRNLNGGLLEKRSKKEGKATSYENQKITFDADRSVEEYRTAAEQACKLAGKSLSDEVRSSLSKDYAECKAKLGCLGYIFSDGKNTLETIGLVKSHQKNSKDVLGEFENKKDEAAEKLRKAYGEKDTAKERVRAFEDQLAKDVEFVEKRIERSAWDANPKEYAEDKLKKDAEKYNKAVSELRDLLNDSTISQLENLGEAVQKIVDLFPGWKEDKLVECKLIEGALGRATTLFGNIQSAYEARNNATEEAEAAEGNVTTFLKDNPSFSLERLSELSAIEDVKNIRQEVNEKFDKVRELDIALKVLEEQRDKLNQPEINDEDTLDTLSGMIGELENEIAKLNQELGAKREELRIDRDKKKGIAALEDAKAAAQKDYDEWHVIASELGDKEGKKFQRIAQSFILKNLLDSANSYLQEKKLADRYKLIAVPNTLHISIEDAYQGYATRSTDSLSGGESFLVSLALALALSDIGEGLAVDTLFIDEGFGTLSGEPLTKAINVLRALHNNSGRHIGIISHIEEVKNNIPVQIQVEQAGGSSSSSIKVEIAL